MDVTTARTWADYYSSLGFKPTPLFAVGPDGRTCHCSKGANCGSAGKHNIFKLWQSDLRGTAILDEVRYPSMNLGILTGEPSGVFVLDIDPLHGGKESMQELVAKNGPMPATRIHETGSGGWHYFFTMPDFPVTNSARGLGAGLDIRGTGGQVVAPPSVSALGGYRVLNNGPVLSAPAWLLDFLHAKTVRPEPTPRPAGEIPAVAAPAYERAAIQGELSRVAGLEAAGWREPWDSTTFEVACQLIELANAEWTQVDAEQAKALFLAACPPAEPGYDPEAKWASAAARVGSGARPAPPEAVSAASAMDDLFGPPPPRGGPPDPTPAGAADRESATPADMFFDKAGIKAALVAGAIANEGPIRLGQDGRWWTYHPDGYWREERGAVQARAARLLGDRYRSSFVTTLEHMVALRAERLWVDNPDGSLINFSNGMLDWRSGTMTPHDPAHGSIVQLGTAYEPGAQCPRFDAFLASSLSEDYVHVVWQMIAYLMFTGNPLQKAFLLHGTGGNGKGTLMRVLNALLGQRNTTALPLNQLSESRFATAQLFGKTANLAGDIDATFQESTAVFKTLTGEDRLLAENKFADSFSFSCWAVPVFSANKIPGSVDVSVGYLRRWVVIEFKSSFVGAPIPGLSDQLIEELPGIAAKALTYLPALMDRALFDVRGEANEGMKLFADSIDQVRQFLEEWAYPSPGTKVPRDIFYQRYRSWALANGHRRPLRSSDFYARLAATGAPTAKVRGVRMLCDISLRNPTDSAVTPIDDFWRGTLSD